MKGVARARNLAVIAIHDSRAGILKSLDDMRNVHPVDGEERTPVTHRIWVPVPSADMREGVAELERRRRTCGTAFVVMRYGLNASTA